MRLPGRLAACLLLLPALAGCTGAPEQPETEAVDTATRLEGAAAQDPGVLLARIQRAVDQTALRATVTPASPDHGPAYTFLAGAQGEWGVSIEVTDETGEPSPANLVAVDGQICFDEPFRPRLAQLTVESYGAVDFDPEPWSCTPEVFGLNALATFDFRREDPRWRIAHLDDDPSSLRVEVTERDGEPLLLVRTTGVTQDGPLDPARPGYDLWVDADLRPVVMETANLRWAFAYPDEPTDPALTVPPADRRGSYGYVVGPGQGLAKACHQSGGCRAWEQPLIWGDGRRS